MNKKLFMTISLIVLASCTGTNNSSSQTNFTFDGLSVDLNNISQLAIFTGNVATINRNQGRRINSIENNEPATTSYLVGLNSNGEYTEITFVNDNNLTVEVPYNLYSIDIVGDFTYLVYYKRGELFEDLKQGILSDLDFYNTPSSAQEYKKMMGTTDFEALLKTSELSSGLIDLMEFIVIHNNSGKVFNFKQIIGLYSNMIGIEASNEILLIERFEDKIFYFVRKKEKNEVGIPMNKATCMVELSFNDNNNTLNKVETCTEIIFQPLFVHNNGYFAYSFDNQMYFSSSDFTITGNLMNYFEHSYKRNMFFRSFGDYIALFYQINTPRIIYLSSTFENVYVIPSMNLPEFLSNENVQNLSLTTVNNSTISTLLGTYINDQGETLPFSGEIDSSNEELSNSITDVFQQRLDEDMITPYFETRLAIKNSNYPENIYESTWKHRYDNYDYFQTYSDLFYVNFITGDFDSINFSSISNPLIDEFGSFHKHIIFEQKIYLVASTIAIIDYTTKNYVILETGIYEVLNDVAKILSTGYLEYSISSGLTRIKKYLNLQTGLVYLESEQKPIINITQINPIN